MGEVGGVHLIEEFGEGVGGGASGSGDGLERVASGMGQIGKVFEHGDGEAASDLVALFVARQMGNGGVERGGGGDGDAGIGMTPSGGENVRLNAGGADGGIGGGDGTVEDEDGRKVRIGGGIEDELIPREIGREVCRHGGQWFRR